MTPLDIFSVVIATIFGALIGSFLNVVILRVPAGKSLLDGSSCPKCSRKLTPWENIPILSWLFLRGKCHGCGNKISIQYPLVEIATALLFLAATYLYLLPIGEVSFASVLFYIALLYLISVAVALFVIDAREKLLPNSIVLPSYFVAGILLISVKLLENDPAGILWILLGGIICFCFYLLLALISKGIGGGDIKLAGVLGLYLGHLGLGHVILGAIGAFVLGGIYGIILVVFRKAGAKSEVAFGPWMLISALITIVYGSSIIEWYLSLLSF